MQHKRGIVVMLKSAFILAAMAGGLLLATLITDIHDDRSYQLVITGTVTVYADSALPDPTDVHEVVTVLGPGDEVEVRRIDRDGGWVRVRLADRREGYIFLDSKVELRRN
jgi:hypothetical protein